MDPAVDREVVAGGLEVLADGDDVARVAAGLVVLVAGSGVVCGHRDEVVEHVEDFFFAFTDADHDAGLGDGALCFDAFEEFHRALIAGAWSHGWMTAADGLEVVGDDVGLRVDDHLERGFVAFEVSDEDLDGHVGACFSGSQNGFGPDPCAAVGDIIAVHGGDDDVLESSASEGFSDSSWFVFVDCGGFAGFDIAESAGAGAGVSQDHDGRDPARPALSHVGTRGFFADGVEVVGVDVGFGGAEVLAAGEFGFEPAWFLLDAQVVDGVVLVVEDHGVEGEGGFEGADGVAAEWSWVAGEGPGLSGIAGSLRGGGLILGWEIVGHCESLCRRIGGLENGMDLSGVGQHVDCCALGDSGRGTGRAILSLRPKTMRFSGSESTWMVPLVDGAG